MTALFLGFYAIYVNFAGVIFSDNIYMTYGY